MLQKKVRFDLLYRLRLVRVHDLQLSQSVHSGLAHEKSGLFEKQKFTLICNLCCRPVQGSLLRSRYLGCQARLAPLMAAETRTVFDPFSLCLGLKVKPIR